MVQCMKYVLFVKCETRDMRDVRAMYIMRAMNYVKYDMK